MKKRRKRFWFLILMFFTLFFLIPKTAGYIKGKIINKGKTFSIMKEIELPHVSQTIYQKLDNNIIKYWEGVLFCYDILGEKRWSINLGIANPIIKNNNNSIFVVDNSKKEIIRISKEGELLYRVFLQNQVHDIKTCEEDYILLQYISDKNTPQKISIIDGNGNEISNISLGQGEITSLAISKNHNKIAIGTLGINQNEIESSLLVYDLIGNLLTLESHQSNIILECIYDSKGNLIVLEEGEVSCINKENVKLWSVNPGQIQQIGISPDNFIVIYSCNDRRGMIYTRSGEKIKILKYNGKWLGENKIEEEIKGIDSYKDDVLVYSSRTLYILDKKANIKIKHQYNSDINKAYILSNGYIAIVTKEKLSFLEMKRQ